MKFSIFILSSILSISTFAADLAAKGTLDFRSVSGGLNAGHYEVTTEITSTSSATEGYIERTINRYDNDYFCVSTVKFPVGTLKYTLKNLETGNVLVEEIPLFAETSQEDETQACTKRSEEHTSELQSH